MLIYARLCKIIVQDNTLRQTSKNVLRRSNSRYLGETKSFTDTKKSYIQGTVCQNVN